MTKICFSAFISLFCLSLLHGQGAVQAKGMQPSRIYIERGIGKYAVVDEFISPEKYAGLLPYAALRWTRDHGAYNYQVYASFRQGAHIKNHNISTTITQFTLNQGFLYPLGNSPSLQNRLSVFWGPSTLLHIYYNDLNMSVSGFDFAQSVAGQVSICLNLMGEYQVNPDIAVYSALEMSALSLGFGRNDKNSDEQSAFQILSAFSGLYSSFDLDLQYSISQHLNCRIGYKFELLRMTVWEPLNSASDNLILAISYGF